MIISKLNMYKTLATFPIYCIQENICPWAFFSALSPSLSAGKFQNWTNSNISNYLYSKKNQLCFGEFKTEQNRLLVKKGKISQGENNTVKNTVIILFVQPLILSSSGYIGPGGLHDSGKYYNCTAGAAAYIDIMVLGKNHIYGKPTPHVSYSHFLSSYKEA